MKQSNVARLTILFSLLLFLFPSLHSLAQQEECAKWGKIAVEKVREKYPNQKLVDYAYERKIYIFKSTSEI